MLEDIRFALIYLGISYLIYILSCAFGQFEDRLEDIVEKEHRSLSTGQKAAYILLYLPGRLFMILHIIAIVPLFIGAISRLLQQRLITSYEREISDLKYKVVELEDIAKRSPGNPYYDPMYF